MKLIILFLSTLILSSQSFAGEFSCPETHPEYNKMLEELQTFQKQLEDKLECEEVAAKFDKLTDLVGAKKRGAILSLVSNTEGKALSAENAKKIQDYASSVTEEVGVLVGLVGSAINGERSWVEVFTGTDRCTMDDEDQLAGIEKLTKAAYEATNLISKVAGPYGVPLQVGVSAVRGVVLGLQNYSKRASHIDFDNLEKRQFFESAVCIMSKFDSDIRKLNNPEAHLRNLKVARAQAERVVNTVRVQCETCQGVLDANSSDEAKLAFQNMNSEFRSLGEKAYEGKVNLEWIDNEIKKFNEIAKFKTGGIGARDLEDQKIRINGFILGTAAPEFIKWYTKKATESNYDFAQAISAAKYELVQNVKDSGQNFEMGLPDSIEKDFKPKHDSQGNLQAYTMVSPSVRYTYVAQAPEISTLYFMALNQNKLQGPAYSYYSRLGEAQNVWKLSDLTVRVVQEYCSFFEESLTYDSAIERACESAKFVWHGLKIGYQSFYLASLINGSDIMDRLGPFDFRLEDHYVYLEKYRKMRKGVLRLAEEGIDIFEVLNEDRSVRQKDGRWNPYGNDFEDPSWWNQTKYQADAFLQDFYSLK